MTTPSYYNIAVAEIGQREVEGSKSNPRVLEYQTAAGYNAKQDDVAWCGSFVSWCLQQAGIPYRFDTGAQAADWAKFGKALKEPVVGAIMVWPHHVGFFAGWVDSKKKSFRLLSGNSGGAAAGGGEVRISTYGSLAGVIAIRWPDKMPVPQEIRNPLNNPAIKGTAGAVGGLAVLVTDNQDVILGAVDKVQDRISQGQIIAAVAAVVILFAVGYVIWSQTHGGMLAKKFSKPVDSDESATTP
jgi:uncharacterized protein (TIGR02594 family)